jgi:hypothetical protein
MGVGREERGERMSLLECNLEAALALPGAQWTGLGLVAALLRCCASAGLSCTRESLFVRANPEAPFFARRSANFGIASLLAVPDPWIGRSCKARCGHVNFGPLYLVLSLLCQVSASRLPFSERRGLFRCFSSCFTRMQGYLDPSASL